MNYLTVFQNNGGQINAYTVSADTKAVAIRVTEAWMEDLGYPVEGEVVAYTPTELRDLADMLEHDAFSHDIPTDWIPGA